LINFYSGQFFYFIFYYFSIYFHLIFASFLFHFFLIFTITTIRKHIYLDHLNLNILTILLSHFFFGKLPIRLQPNNLFFDHTIIDLKHEHNYFLNLFPLLFFLFFIFFFYFFLPFFFPFISQSLQYIKGEKCAHSTSVFHEKLAVTDDLVQRNAFWCKGCFLCKEMHPIGTETGSSSCF
jgi:hypothetical protein